LSPDETFQKIRLINPHGKQFLPPPGARLRAAIETERPLQVVGAVNAYCAMLAERAGFRALYLSGAGVANASFGLPDLGLTTLNDVCEDIRRITQASSLPLLVDADTGWGGAFMIARTIREMSRAGAAGCHLEDQVQAKRCGHRPGKELVSSAEMCDRLKAAVDARTDASFVVMARTDAHASEGLQAAIERSQAYVAAGADMIFAEALTTLGEYRQFTTAMGENVPVLANITEFGKTPLFTVDELGKAGVRLVLYPLSAFRAMSNAAATVYETLRTQGTQREVTGLGLEAMAQRRMEMVRMTVAKQLALGMTGSAIEKWEKNQNYPTPPNRIRMIEFLGFDPEPSPFTENYPWFHCHIPMMPAYTPKPAVNRTIKPTSQAYHPLSRQGSGSALRANRYKKPRTMGSSRAFITFTLMASFTELTPESTMPAPISRLTT
jgi:methylisocitrate lyase